MYQKKPPFILSGKNAEMYSTTSMELLTSKNDEHCRSEGVTSSDNYGHDHTTRRDALATILCALSTTAASPALALASNEFDKMSSLTRQVRKSVVRGAQLIDKVDGQWEQFSDAWGLGSERNRPKRNVIDAGGNDVSKKVVKSDIVVGDVDLDGKFAFDLLQVCDEVGDIIIFNHVTAF